MATYTTKPQVFARETRSIKEDLQSRCIIARVVGIGNMTAGIEAERATLVAVMWEHVSQMMDSYWESLEVQAAV